MVVCDLREAPGAQPVAARIADMAHQQPAVAEHADDERRAHPGVLRIRVGGVEDRAVGVVDADVHRAPHVGVRRVGRRLLQPAPELGLDERGGHAARHLAGVVAAHAVGQHDQRRGFIHGHRVLVVVASASRVGGAEELETHGAVEGGMAAARDQSGELCLGSASEIFTVSANPSDSGGATGGSGTASGCAGSKAAAIVRRSSASVRPSA